jgi:hypothetical protein
LEIGLNVKEPKARKAAGLIVMLRMAKAAISHVVEPTERRGRNTPPAGLPQAHAKKEVKVELGARKLRREAKINEYHK